MCLKAEYTKLGGDRKEVREEGMGVSLRKTSHMHVWNACMNSNSEKKRTWKNIYALLANTTSISIMDFSPHGLRYHLYKFLEPLSYSCYEVNVFLLTSAPLENLCWDYDLPETFLDLGFTCLTVYHLLLLFAAFQHPQLWRWCSHDRKLTEALMKMG